MIASAVALSFAIAGVPSPRMLAPSTLRAAAGDEPDAATRQRAAEAFAAGERAYEAEEWAAAVEHFEEAQELAPHPFTEFNLGLALARAGRTVEAWHTFDALAKHAKAEQDRIEAREQQAALRESVAMVRVEARADAVVCLDGEAIAIGSTKVVEPGAHRLRVDVDERALELEGGETRQVDVRSAAGAPPRSKAVRPLLGVAIGSGVLALGLGVGPLVTDDRRAEIGLGVTAGTFTAVAIATTIAAVVLHEKSRRTPSPRAPACERSPALAR